MPGLWSVGWSGKREGGRREQEQNPLWQQQPAHLAPLLRVTLLRENHTIGRIQVFTSAPLWES